MKKKLENVLGKVINERIEYRQLRKQSFFLSIISVGQQFKKKKEKWFDKVFATGASRWIRRARKRPVLRARLGHKNSPYSQRKSLSKPSIPIL